MSVALRCTACGRQLGSGDRFCADCGSPVQQGETTQSGPATTGQTVPPVFSIGQEYTITQRNFGPLGALSNYEISDSTGSLVVLVKYVLPELKPLTFHGHKLPMGRMEGMPHLEFRDRGDNLLGDLSGDLSKFYDAQGALKALIKLRPGLPGPKWWIEDPYGVELGHAVGNGTIRTPSGEDVARIQIPLIEGDRRVQILGFQINPLILFAFAIFFGRRRSPGLIKAAVDR